MSVVYEGPSELAKRIDKSLGIILLFSAIVILAVSMVSKAFGEDGILETEPTNQTEPQSSRVFYMGQEVMVEEDTLAYESSKECGSEGEWKLDATKIYLINGYSYVYEDGKFREHDYKKPSEVTKIGGEEEIEEPQEGEKTLMLHLCLIDGEKETDEGWVWSKNVIPK